MGTIRCALVRCESSNLSAYGYAREAQVLVAVFKDGQHWAYDAVEPERWAGMVMAESKGRYLRNEVQAWRRGRKVSPHAIEEPSDE